ncbi:hypothetical protein P7H41_13690, partial [Vagococcus fluvialis]|uniref:hypothetical protein n=1 Tax=Vagococcus fluvialis TaxID=2738 RepID=UPI00288EA270
IIGNPSLNHRYRKGFYSLFKTLQQNQHVSPINWEHITFLGEYKFDLLSIPKHLRELNIKNK